MKPGDFLIGLRDFFAVLIPNAVLTFLVASFQRWAEPYRAGGSHSLPLSRISGTLRRPSPTP